MMANYPYYPTYYNGYQQPAAAPQGSGIVWVQGETGAKSYLVGAGQSVLLMDAEGSTFYIKSTDASGMPMPLRVFDYTERNKDVKPLGEKEEYVTHEELKKWTDDLLKKWKGDLVSKFAQEGGQNGE